MVIIVVTQFPTPRGALRLCATQKPRATETATLSGEDTFIFLIVVVIVMLIMLKTY